MNRSVELVKFNRGMCKALHLGRNYPVHQYMLGVSLLESSFAEKELGSCRTPRV